MLRQDEAQTPKQSLDRRRVYAVIVCLGPLSSSAVIDRCHRKWGMSAFEVEERIDELFRSGVIEAVGQNAAHNRLWQATRLPRTETRSTKLTARDWGKDRDAE